jgi:hypothetical protein
VTPIGGPWPAALRDIVTRTTAILHLTPSGKHFDYQITILK